MVLPNPLDAVYGRFDRITPQDARALLDGFDCRWWISGGWAIEAFTGIARPHEDIDISIERDSLPDLIRHFLGTHHVWAAGSGQIKPLLRPADPLPAWAGQVWLREDASSPWLVDFLLSPMAEDEWIFKRDPFVHLPFDTATWIDDQGLRYEQPEIAILYKAKHDREKDREDLAAALLLMSSKQIGWLADSVRRVHPGHPWIDLLPN